jgi:hypothetical protein
MVVELCAEAHVQTFPSRRPSVCLSDRHSSDHAPERTSVQEVTVGNRSTKKKKKQIGRIISLALRAVARGVILRRSPSFHHSSLLGDCNLLWHLITALAFSASRDPTMREPNVGPGNEEKRPLELEDL